MALHERAQLERGLARRDAAHLRRWVPDGNMRQLEDYTFDDPEQWIRWWEENHERLRLTPDGRHVIVGK